eukprot:4349776-Amphidinium_carterae.1
MARGKGHSKNNPSKPKIRKHNVSSTTLPLSVYHVKSVTCAGNAVVDAVAELLKQLAQAASEADAPAACDGKDPPFMSFFSSRHGNNT